MVVKCDHYHHHHHHHDHGGMYGEQQEQEEENESVTLSPQVLLVALARQDEDLVGLAIEGHGMTRA